MQVFAKISCCMIAWSTVAIVAVQGQPVVPRVDSLQWMVASSDLIVRGTTESVTPLNPGDNYLCFYDVTLKVRETFLGASRDRIRFVACSGEVDPLNKLTTSGHEGLLFLTSSRKDFNRQTADYYYIRHQFAPRNVIDLDDRTATVVSFGQSGPNHINGPETIVDEVRSWSGRRRVGERVRPWELIQESTLNEQKGVEPIIRVPADQYLWKIAQQWSQPEGINERAGKKISDAFVRILDYEQAKGKYAATDQVPTPKRPINSLSIDSAEWMAADSDLIVRGTIEEVVLLKLADPNNHDDYQATVDSHYVELRVAGTVKGETGKFVGFHVENGGELRKWKQQKTPLLVFLKDNMIRSIDPPVRLRSELEPSRFDVLRYSARGAGSAAIVAFEKPQPKILSMNLQWLDDSEVILRTVQHYLREVSNTPEERVGSLASFSFQPRQFFTAGRPWQENAYARIYFPIDAYLEKQARQWINSGEKEHRWAGVAALAYFKTDENAAILKGLLNDPGKWLTPVPVSIYSDLKVEYLVRWEAWTI
jgi:hypothetical protein